MSWAEGFLEFAVILSLTILAIAFLIGGGLVGVIGSVL